MHRVKLAATRCTVFAPMIPVHLFASEARSRSGGSAESSLGRVALRHLAELGDESLRDGESRPIHEALWERGRHVALLCLRETWAGRAARSSEPSIGAGPADRPPDQHLTLEATPGFEPGYGALQAPA